MCKKVLHQRKVLHNIGVKCYIREKSDCTGNLTGAILENVNGLLVNIGKIKLRGRREE